MTQSNQQQYVLVIFRGEVNQQRIQEIGEKIYQCLKVSVILDMSGRRLEFPKLPRKADKTKTIVKNLGFFAENITETGDSILQDTTCERWIVRGSSYRYEVVRKGMEYQSTIERGRKGVRKGATRC